MCFADRFDDFAINASDPDARTSGCPGGTERYHLEGNAELDTLIDDGLVTLERVEVLTYRGQRRERDASEPSTEG